MTRETKIGLLVGLAFIIVIGILLSDYNRIESPTAPLFGDNRNLRKGVGTPTAADNKSQSDKTPDTIVYPVKANSPRQQVPTREDLAPPQGNSDVVVISPFDGASSNPQRAGNPPQHTISGGSSEVAINQPRGNVPQDLQNTARDHGTELVPAGQNEPRTNTGPATATNNNTALTAGRQYTAEPADTVSKMAGRFMGGNTKANRDAIVAANPSLQKNINNVVVGHVYVIPQSAATATTPPTTPALAQKPQPQTPAAPVNQPAQSPTHWYTVKENDSLWKIAQEQLGDGNAVAAIKELNKDVLKGGDAIRPNMRLRMPAKPVASAS